MVSDTFGRQRYLKYLQEGLDMEIRNCRKCGKMFNYITGPQVCQSCKEAAEKKFQEVKDYVRDHKTASIPDICKDCGVEPKQVQQWIREERLIFADDSPVKISCEICGKQISTGRYCAQCKRDTAAGISEAAKRPDSGSSKMNLASNSHKMHTFNN